MYLARRRPLLGGMETPTAGHRSWRSLTRLEKQRRLDRLRQAQRQQVARDARVLLLVRSG